LPAGNGQLVSLQWQPLPGAPEAQFFPLIRKIDTISSNSYLIQTADAIILIDPGGIPEQAEQLMQVVTECRREKERPFFVILTHIHSDHFFGIQDVPAFAFAATTTLMVQESGAAALERGDERYTVADLFSLKIRPMRVGIHLLAPGFGEHPGIPAGICLANGGRLTVTGWPADRALLLPDREEIRFGPSGPPVEFYHTPGHSVDSICIRIGGVLFIGDLLFAANPGVAGLVGWSQEALVRSLQEIGELIGRGGISVICPGHGRFIMAEDAAKTIAMVKRDASALTDIAELNPHRAEDAALYAEECMEVVNELFTIMAGRLYYVGYVLEELGESEIAEETSALIQGKDMDELLEAFRTFADEHHRAGGRSIHLALKAGQVIGKMQRLFRRDELANIIDPTMVHRAERLLSDYITMFRGFTPPREITVTDLNGLIEALAEGHSVQSCSDDDFLSSADDEEAFGRILLARLGTKPLLEDVDFSVSEPSGPVPVAIDRDHFSDLLTYILEDLVGTGSDAIRIGIERIDSGVGVTVSGTVSPGRDLGRKKTSRFLSGLCERAGGSLAFSQEPGCHCTYTITISHVI